MQRSGTVLVEINYLKVLLVCVRQRNLLSRTRILLTV